MVITVRLLRRSLITVIKYQPISTTVRDTQQIAIQQHQPLSSSPARVLDKRISLRQSNFPTIISNAFDITLIENERHTRTDIASPIAATATARPLVVLLTWLNAQHKHIEKYRNLYFERGFDVLTVETSPVDLLVPNGSFFCTGARKIAQNCVLQLETELKQYQSVILHAFSVGAYQFGEILIEMQRQKEEHERETRMQAPLEKRIKGIVFDSVVPIEEVANGVSRAISSNRFVSNFLKSSLDFYLQINQRYASKYYRGASVAVWGNYMRIPALIMVSRNDKIGTASANERLANVWRGLSIDVTYQCWEQSEHVQHLPRHTKEYEELVDQFLGHKINLNPNNNSIPYY